MDPGLMTSFYARELDMSKKKKNKSVSLII